MPVPHFPRRLRALRVWKVVRAGNIAIQPDPAEHKLDSAGSFSVPEWREKISNALPEKRYNVRTAESPVRLIGSRMGPEL